MKILLNAHYRIAARSCQTALLILLPLLAQAQGYPAKPIRILVGPGPDVIARTFAQKFTDAWGQQIVIDQRPGAGGNIAAELAAKAPTDGYTLLVATSAFAANVILQPGPFDLVKDFAPVALFATSPLILTVHPSVPATTVQELVALAKARPGQLNYASTGNGTAPHLGGEMFKTAARIDLVHVPYKGAGPAIVDVMAGQIQVYFQIEPGVLGALQSGKIRGLAVSSLQRSKLAPELPTMSEAGYPGFHAAGWNGLVAPAGSPRAVINQLHAEIIRLLAHPDVTKRLTGAGWEPASTSNNTPDTFGQFIKSEIAKFAKVIKENGLKVD